MQIDERRLHARKGIVAFRLRRACERERGTIERHDRPKRSAFLRTFQQGTSSGNCRQSHPPGCKERKQPTASLDRPLSCNGRRATKTLLRRPQIATDRHACQMLSVGGPLTTDSIEAKKIEEQLKIPKADLKVTKPEEKLPTVIIWDVLKVNLDEDIVRSMKTHSRRSRLESGKGRGVLQEADPTRPRVPSDTESSSAKTCLINVPIARVPRRRKIPDPERGRALKCINCIKASREDTVHGAFSSECGVRPKWNEIARFKVAYC
ncbi:hypothetical protein EVAR_76966_1 [Eumeta japonica]|uniref:Uncharacterized protein n=1 Tax=Eumeta variegata TaxID=151549 RepID=A0A4C1SF54_EUMVA|nr:hypothetical protein EVAR_76966_1 [Eumeta japonica]